MEIGDRGRSPDFRDVGRPQLGAFRARHESPARGDQGLGTPGETRTLEKRHAIKPITTRTYHPGRHLVDVLINGKICAEGRLELEI